MLRRVGAIGRRPRLAPPVHLLRSACLSSSARPGEVDFSDAQLAYSAMSNADLVRAIAVFTACGFGPVVRNAEALLSTATRVFGHRFVAALVRPTFFKHFCVGEDVDGIAPVLSRLRAFGIGGILDYAAEADLVEPTGAPENSAGHPGTPPAALSSSRDGAHICQFRTEKCQFRTEKCQYRLPAQAASPSSRTGSAPRPSTRRGALTGYTIPYTILYLIYPFSARCVNHAQTL
jgi:hypothetical protein